jgi:CheY-like chemotaxis protein
MLVADDSRVVHRMFANAVAAWQQPVVMVTAFDGLQCVAACERHAIDVAFIDVAMPEMDGLEAITRLRYRGDRTFVTLISGTGSDVRFQLARHLKIYEFLLKPFSPQDVHRILRVHQRVSMPTRALVVDDSATVRKMVGKVLAGSVFSISVEEAATGEHALAMCEGGCFDIIFLDCNMPGLDGFDTLAGILTRNPDAKVIMMSGEADATKTARAHEAGALEFIAKPFYPRDIDRVLHMVYGLVPPVLTHVPEAALPNLPPLPV